MDSGLHKRSCKVDATAIRRTESAEFLIFWPPPRRGSLRRRAPRRTPTARSPRGSRPRTCPRFPTARRQGADALPSETPAHGAGPHPLHESPQSTIHRREADPHPPRSRHSLRRHRSPQASTCQSRPRMRSLSSDSSPWFPPQRGRRTTPLEAASHVPPRSLAHAPRFTLRSSASPYGVVSARWCAGPFQR